MRGRHSRLAAASLLAFILGVGLAFAGDRLLVGGSPARPTSLPVTDSLAVERAVLIPRDDLPDAAIAVYDSVAPRIYLNPRLLAQIGPELAEFLLAHEEGHLAYRHVAERRFGLLRVETPVPVLHAFEFDADCYAARALRAGRPAAVLAALRFFQRRRDLVTDAEHPRMGARADRLLECLTDPSELLSIRIP
jgi:Zn-dependent protease with chaperone function